MSVYYVLGTETILVKGKTYPYREVMRSLGAQYNAGDKSWLVPNTPDNVAKVGELCKSVGGGLIKETTFSPQPSSLPSPIAPAYASPKNSGTPTTLSTYQSPSLPSKSLGIELESEAVAKASDGYSIAELMRQAQLSIAQSFPRSLWVIGEIQNIRWHATGVYFQLADSKEGGSGSATVTVNATLWRSQLKDLERKFGETLREVMQDGFRVRVLADLTLFKDRGQLSLQIQSIDPNFTKGSLALAREKLLKELRAKGLDRSNKSLLLTPFPFKIGLLSAEDSRAKSDFIDQLKVYGFPGSVLFLPCQMQGESTLRDVVAGIKELQKSGCDLIVMTRGGGSAADLRWFDSPEIAYAIVEAKIPILAAIGHHEDVCVAEEICFQREKTPTAAADFIITLFQKTRERLDQLGLVLDKSLNERVKLFDSYLLQLTEKMRAGATHHLNDQRRLIDHADASLELNWQRRVLQWTSRLAQQQSSLGQGLSLRLDREQARLDQKRTSITQSLDLRIQRELSKLEHAKSALFQALNLKVHKEISRIEQHRSALQSKALLQTERLETRVRDIAKDLKRTGSQSLQATEQALARAEASIKQKDPQPWLAQGWTQLESEHGLVRLGRPLSIGQTLKARLVDSLVELSVKSVHVPTHEEAHNLKQGE
ncbi:MAG: exodeoxyribonuclease VII large subunit [Chitinophagaceae bacterium]|nr:exodeoxyribonuclease VII large subunit [Oligoflexus sp.]